MFKRILNVFRLLFPVLFASNLPQFSTAAAGNVQAGHFPRGRFNYYGRTNGASRRRKSNMLRVSKQRRLKHRHA